MAVASGVQPAQRRSLALDALRGLSILLMVFADTMPNGLPSWMYHGQLPPPARVFIPTLAGITWVDLVFPFFLFTMGAAIPLALSRRIESGFSNWKVVKSLLFRGFLLVWFAIFFMQVNPGVLSNNPDWKTWLVGLLGFALLFPVFARLPNNWSKTRRYVVRAIGWGGSIITIALVRFPNGSGFSLYRSDDIIMILATAAVFGGLVWLMTRNSWTLRLGIMGILLAFRLSSGGPVWLPDMARNSPIFVPMIFSAAPSQWLHSLWLISPFPWLFQMRFLQYLFIIIPGTIVGDMILRWMRKPAPESLPDSSAWTKGRMVLLSALMVVINFVVIIGLKAQWVLGTSIITFVLLFAGWRLVANPVGSGEQLINSFFKWGTYWLILGLMFEPYEGGIKKDPATMSYYFVSAGLAIFVLIALTVLIDVLNYKRSMRFMIDCGQNPLVAYVGGDILIAPIFGLTGLSFVLRILTPTPWLGLIGDAVIVYLVALVTVAFTRKKIFLRT